MVYIASLSEHVQIYTKLMQINAMVFINCNSCSHLNVLSKILPYKNIAWRLSIHDQISTQPI